MLSSILLLVLLSFVFVDAHLAAWHKSMYCLGGNTGVDDPNASAPTTPLYMLTKSQWWFHHVDGCDTFPPKAGNFLELPAGGEFTVEISANRATTTLSYNGQYVSDWVDGQQHPDGFRSSTQCITNPNIHTQNETMAAGTAFAISYNSNLQDVTPENLVVFSVLYHTPWRRLATYQVPAALPACPPDGCTCAWGWIPNGCGEANIYHEGFKCMVTNATSTKPVPPGKPPVWCEDNQSNCVKGPKQMLYWHQADGNNIYTSGNDLSGMPKSPAYNSKCGFAEGAQNDIFLNSPQGADINQNNNEIVPSTSANSGSSTTIVPTVSNSSGTTPPVATPSNASSSPVNPVTSSPPANPSSSSAPLPPPPTSSTKSSNSNGTCSTASSSKASKKKPGSKASMHHRRRITSW